MTDLATRLANAPIWADDEDPEGFVAVDISPAERDIIVAALRQSAAATPTVIGESGGTAT